MKKKLEEQLKAIAQVIYFMGVQDRSLDVAIASLKENVGILIKKAEKRGYQKGYRTAKAKPMWTGLEKMAYAKGYRAGRNNAFKNWEIAWKNGMKIKKVCKRCGGVYYGQCICTQPLGKLGQTKLKK